MIFLLFVRAISWPSEGLDIDNIYLRRHWTTTNHLGHLLRQLLIYNTHLSNHAENSCIIVFAENTVQDCKKLAYLAPNKSLWMHNKAFFVTSAFSWFISFITRSLAFRLFTISLPDGWYWINCERSKQATARDLGSLDVSKMVIRTRKICSYKQVLSIWDKNITATTINMVAGGQIRASLKPLWTAMAAACGNHKWSWLSPGVGYNQTPPTGPPPKKSKKTLNFFICNSNHP